MNHAMQHTTLPASVRKERQEVNITPLERFGRIAVGLTGIVGGVLLLARSPTLLTGGLEVLLILAGADLVVTGATGHCPLYKKLGYTPESLKGESHEPGAHPPGGHAACH